MAPAMAVKIVSTPTIPYSAGVSRRARKMPKRMLSTCVVPLLIAPQKRPFAVFSFKFSAIFVCKNTHFGEKCQIYSLFLSYFKMEPLKNSNYHPKVWHFKINVVPLQRNVESPLKGLNNPARQYDKYKNCNFPHNITSSRKRVDDRGFLYYSIQIFQCGDIVYSHCED